MFGRTIELTMEKAKRTRVVTKIYKMLMSECDSRLDFIDTMCDLIAIFGTSIDNDDIDTHTVLDLVNIGTLNIATLIEEEKARVQEVTKREIRDELSRITKSFHEKNSEKGD